MPSGSPGAPDLTAGAASRWASASGPGAPLMALGALVEGPAAECDTCPDGAVAAGGA